MRPCCFEKAFQAYTYFELYKLVLFRCIWRNIIFSYVIRLMKGLIRLWEYSTGEVEYVSSLVIIIGRYLRQMDCGPCCVPMSDTWIQYGVRKSGTKFQSKISGSKCWKIKPMQPMQLMHPLKQAIWGNTWIQYELGKSGTKCQNTGGRGSTIVLNALCTLAGILYSMKSVLTNLLGGQVPSFITTGPPYDRVSLQIFCEASQKICKDGFR